MQNVVKQLFTTLKRLTSTKLEHDFYKKSPICYKKCPHRYNRFQQEWRTLQC